MENNKKFTTPAIPASIQKEFQKLNGCQAVLLTGSRAIGKAGKNADWDFFVILKDGMPRWRKTWKVGGQWLEIFCNDKKQIEKELKEDLKEGRGVTTFMFASGVIIQDSKSKILEKLVRRATANWEKGPTPLSRQEIAWKDYDMATYLQDIEDCLEDGNPALLLTNYAVNEFVNDYYRLNNTWLPRPKDRLNDLAIRDKHLFQMVSKFNTAVAWKNKAALAIDIGKYVGTSTHLKLDGNLHIPPHSGSFHS